jgi:acetoin utilization deacetylase AcuC-like enzyme
MTLALVHHPRFLDHRQDGAGHPERPERLTAIVDLLQSEELWSEPLQPDPAPFEALARAHDPRYLERLRDFGEGHWDADTYVRSDTFEIASLAAGGALLAAEVAWRDRQPALALLRPPGHHATPTRAMGFCYLNNVAVAALAHLAAGRGRVAIVDVDAHHGNGTQEILYARGDALYLSLHQWPLYPGTGQPAETGEGTGAGRTVNIPLPPGCGDATYAEAFARIVEPVLEQFRPTLLFVSLGMDAHYMDPMADMALSTPGYLDLLARLRRAAERLCEGRLVYALEGGYHLEATAEVVAGLAAACAGRPFTPRLTENRAARHDGYAILDPLVARFASWWRLK